MIFWIVVLAMTLLALAFVIPPLFKKPRTLGPDRDAVNIAVYRQRLKELKTDLENDDLTQDQFDQARAELEAEMAFDLNKETAPGHQSPESPESIEAPKKIVAISLATVIPLVSVALYLYFGNLDAISPEVNGGGSQNREKVASIEEMVGRLAARLQSNPEDGEGWAMLGRSYAVLGRATEAGLAYARALELLGDQPQILADYAEALAMANDNRFDTKSIALLDKALELQPDNAKALWLAAQASAQAGDNKQAITYLQRLLAVIPADSEAQQAVKKVIAQLGGQVPDGQTTPTAPTDSAVKTASSIKARVQLQKSLLKQVAPDDTVFIFARAVQGPKMPLAIVRKQIKDLPVTVTLDDSMAMMPQLKLSGFPQVIIGARVSKTGQAIAQSGDLQGLSAPVNTKTKNTVAVTISELIP